MPEAGIGFFACFVRKNAPPLNFYLSAVAVLLFQTVLQVFFIPVNPVIHLF
jgi:hypothetical protein